MRIKRPLACFLKTGLIGFLWLSTIPAWAGSAPPTVGNYKGEAPAPTRKFYKGEVETTEYAAQAIPEQGEYGGQVFTSELYQGPLEGPGYSERGLRDGFYLGLEAGYDSYKMRSSINSTVGGVSVFQQNPELDAVGLTYTALAGFGRVFDDPLYLGAEFFYNDSQASTSENVGLFQGSVGIYNIKTVILGTYGVSVMPGIKLGDRALLFIKGGYTRLDVKTYESSSVLGLNNAQSNGSNGIHFGLGFEAEVYKNWSVRGEYTHVNFQDYSTRLGTEITPSNNQFLFGVVFHFTH